MYSPAALSQFKQIAAETAAELVQSGMIVGLGSGSTAALAVTAIGRRVTNGLRIIGIPTSEQTASQARQLGIPVSTLGEHPQIDITIDGADEVELETLNLIKGRGGALLREKIVATATVRLIIIVDETKIVPRLGVHDSVPVEVIPFGWQATATRLRKLGGEPNLRLGPDGQTYTTDGGHYILDCAFGPVESPTELQRELDSIVGLVEHGLFVGLASQVVVGGPGGIRKLNRSHCSPAPITGL
jgi:ribose 5-phosphate isomerase A